MDRRKPNYQRNCKICQQLRRDIRSALKLCRHLVEKAEAAQKAENTQEVVRLLLQLDDATRVRSDVIRRHLNHSIHHARIGAETPAS